MATLPISQFSELTGFTRETCVKRFAAAGLEATPGPMNSKLFESQSALKALYEVPQSNEQGALMAARTENLIADTKLKTLKEQELLGTVAPIDALEWALQSICQQISAILETIPAKLKRSNPALNQADLHVIKREIAKVQNAAAKCAINWDQAA